MLDPTLSYPAGILATLALDTVSPLQTVILYTLYHKRTATSTAILNLINAAVGNISPFRSQSAISHALADLLARGYLHYTRGLATYQCSSLGYQYVRAYIRTADSIEKRITHLQEALQKMQPVHVENTPPPC